MCVAISSHNPVVSEAEPRLRWLFLDLNSYFASVEQELVPSLRGRPVVVAWKGKRSVVCASTEKRGPSPSL